MTIGIYKIENVLNHKIYIGQSVHIEKRWQEHCRPSTMSVIGTAIKKYGKENFSFQILEECDVEKLDERENYYIDFYNSLTPNGYNIAININGKNIIFSNYSQDIFNLIIKDIKETELSFEEIAKKYDLDKSMIYYLNRGDYKTIPNESYPLRQVKDMRKKHYYCIDCGKEIKQNATRCVECSHKMAYKCEHPDRNTLKALIKEKSFTELAKFYGVSDKTISKWCKSYNLPYRKKDIKKFTDQEWEKI